MTISVLVRMLDEGEAALSSYDRDQEAFMADYFHIPESDADDRWEHRMAKLKGAQAPCARHALNTGETP